MSWHPMRSVDESFFTQAPQIHRFTVDVDVTPERVWASLTSDESLAAWGPSVQAVRWTSARPFGVGTTREVVVALGAVTFREEFIVWDEGRRYAFRGTASNRGGVRALAEDYVVEARPGGARLLWTVALEPAGPAALTRLTAPVTRLAFGRTAADGRRYFAKNP